ncbi:LysR substrate-binding domain-containing protein [Pseudomonas songnenensis]|uniref:LysR family transcriptional regulator n=1 Tax=Pseudomonas songnenensis TaxID=1176259 RepID=A0ABX9USR7_9PSED|nr:LysR substrate-binding domain-containing protein [Pseudomonas songnenensis]MCQ4300177.1 LysR substrate-binding domain-containing protein [Pseudomonas songnenensis]RMH95831.1 LysR family transcriptional regulator [Pseudomonas songnenensis]
MTEPLEQTPATATPLLESDVLRTFVAIAESGSFTRAAGQIYRSTSAASMQIKRLEETLGHSLFVREARQVRLTPAGETLLGYARRLLKLNEEAVAQFRQPTLQGRVRFGTPADVGTRILPGLLALFARSHPGVEVDVSVARSIDMIERIDTGELDLALVTIGNLGQDDSRGEPVHSEPLVWAGRSGGIAALHSPLPLALASPDCAWRRQALDALDRIGRHYRIAYSSEQTSGQEAAMIADLAIAPYPASLLRPPLQRLDGQYGLPPLGDYRINLLRGSNRSEAVDILAEQVIAAFVEYRNPRSGRRAEPSEEMKWHAG